MFGESCVEIFDSLADYHAISVCVYTAMGKLQLIGGGERGADNRGPLFAACAGLQRVKPPALNTRQIREQASRKCGNTYSARGLSLGVIKLFCDTTICVYIFLYIYRRRHDAGKYFLWALFKMSRFRNLSEYPRDSYAQHGFPFSSRNILKFSIVHSFIHRVAPPEEKN